MPGYTHRLRDPESAVVMYQDWLDGCVESHTGCEQVNAEGLPCRLLDLRFKDLEDNIRLVDANEEYRYCALSYCWGNRALPALTSENESDYRRRIPWQLLPQCHKDTVWILRSMGIEYLWIDCYCIVQNDREDWEKESVKMCGIFSSAVFVIVAAKPNDPYEGLLTSEPQRIWETVQAETDDDGSTLVHVRPFHYHYNDAAHGRIQTRAWT